jgi:hypothetical protein
MPSILTQYKPYRFAICCEHGIAIITEMHVYFKVGHKMMGDDRMTILFFNSN